WATLLALGQDGLAEMIEGFCERAVQFSEQLSERGFNVQNDVVFNQVLVQCGSAGETAVTLQNIQASGECWCGGTTWNGEPAIRISVCSWSTTAADVERSVAAFVKARG
ncbi:MAG: aspartate aminotransferase family protein, partial [Chloroflexota bacterium]